METQLVLAYFNPFIYMQNSHQSGHVGWPGARAAWHDVRTPTTSGCGGYLHRTACGCLQARKGLSIMCQWCLGQGLKKDTRVPSAVRLLRRTSRSNASNVAFKHGWDTALSKGSCGYDRGDEIGSELICDASCFCRKAKRTDFLGFLNLLIFFTSVQGTSCQESVSTCRDIWRNCLMLLAARPCIF